MPWLSEIENILSPVLIRTSVAALCGIAVGLERAYRAKPAGIRTHMLISMGSSLFMSVSILAASTAQELGFTAADPGRIAAQVVTGIGFLGAGTIIRNRGFIRGMTSAATIWCMSAIGLAAGAGMLTTAIISSIAIVTILYLFDFFEKRSQTQRFRVMCIEVTTKKEKKIPEVRSILRGMDITLSHERINRILTEIHYQANILFFGDKEEIIEKKIKDIKGIKNIVLLTPGDIWEV